MSGAGGVGRAGVILVFRIFVPTKGKVVAETCTGLRLGTPECLWSPLSSRAGWLLPWAVGGSGNWLGLVPQLAPLCLQTLLGRAAASRLPQKMFVLMKLSAHKPPFLGMHLLISA